MKVHSYMLSLLGVRRATQREGFLTAFPHAWLVWEPGTWAPTDRRNVRTIVIAAAPTAPASGDALAFELRERTALTVGRNDDRDLVLNDATVSREHATLHPEGDGWSLKITGASHSLVGGKPFTSLSLRSGQQVQLGGVTLTFLSAAGMAGRLDAQLASLKKPKS